MQCRYVTARTFSTIKVFTRVQIVDATGHGIPFTVHLIRIRAGAAILQCAIEPATVAPDRISDCNFCVSADFWVFSLRTVHSFTFCRAKCQHYSSFPIVSWIMVAVQIKSDAARQSRACRELPHTDETRRHTSRSLWLLCKWCEIYFYQHRKSNPSTFVREHSQSNIVPFRFR